MTNVSSKERRHRIDYEIIVDCYDEYEQAMGWIIYLKENLKTPFKARYVENPQIPDVQPGKIIEVIELVNQEDDEELEHFEAMVEIREGNNVCEIPLSEVEAIDTDQDTKQAVEDWHYWMGRGYQF